MGPRREVGEGHDRLKAMAAVRSSLSRELARHFLAQQAQGLPEAIAAKARLHVADSVGIALAAHKTQVASQVLKAMAPEGSAGPAGVIGLSRGAAAPQAAFANAALIHILDFDDIHDEARLHPTPVALSAALAAASLCQADGKRVLEATVLGDELICRLGAMIGPTGSGPASDWFLTQLFGYLGATLAASLVLGHDEDTLTSALGLAAMQAAGSKQPGFGTGATARAIYPAFAAQGGVQASLLAGAGITGPEASLDGAAGLFRIYLGMQVGDAQRDAVLTGSKREFARIEIKPWPSCRLSHPYVAAALDMRAQLLAAGVAMEQVEHVEAAVNASAAKLCRPIDERRKPATLQDAKYSIPWMTAFTLSRGEVSLATLNEAALAAPDVPALAQRVDIDERLPDNAGHPPAELRVRAAGRVFESKASGNFGLDGEGVRAKFNASLADVARGGQADSLWAQVATLDARRDLAFLYAA
jgi:2-methylcitrate dehydratase PrpD